MPHPRGPDHHSAKLTWPQVLTLRASYHSGTPLRALARIYHLDPHTVFDIVHNISWYPEPVSARGSSTSTPPSKEQSHGQKR